MGPHEVNGATADPPCPRGHASTDPDYCSVCGAPMPVLERGGPEPSPEPPTKVVLLEPSGPGPAGEPDWEVAIAVDPSLDPEPDPGQPPPPGGDDRLFPIDQPEMLVGRRDDRHRIRPDIPIRDPGVSRRHAHLLRLAGGQVGIVDLESANGTVVNGIGLVPGERRELDDGDVVTMGRWTRITVRRRRPGRAGRDRTRGRAL